MGKIKIELTTELYLKLFSEFDLEDSEIDMTLDSELNLELESELRSEIHAELRPEINSMLNEKH